MRTVAYPNDPRQGGAQPPQGPPPGPPSPHGPPGAYQAPQGPAYGQGPAPGPGYPPPGYPPQGQPPGYPPQGPPPGYPPQGYPGGPPPPKRGASPWLIVGGIALALVLAGGAVFGGVWLYNGAVGSGSASGGGVAGGGEPGIDGVETFEILDYSHVDIGEKVDYDQFPPAGGQHYPTWQNCGVYAAPVMPELAVHSQEHGAVWITYDPDLSVTDVQTLTDLHTPGSYVIVSPMEGLPSAVVASGWGVQLQLDEADDPRLGEFLREYEQSPNVPEPGAACSGAVDQTQEEVEAALSDETDARRN
ncbi:hypothetical protein GCM10009603_29520 [Nocardiopsis exhalans]